MKRFLVWVMTIIILLTGNVSGLAQTEPEATWTPEQTDLFFLLLRQSLEKETGISMTEVDLKISNVQIEKSGSQVWCTGMVTNESSRTVYEFVKVKGEFKDLYGNIVDTDIAYASGGEGLAPGESSSFTLSVNDDYSIKDCTVTIYEADESIKESYPALSSLERDLEIKDLKLEQTSSSMKCTGRIRNNSSDTSYKFIKVKGAFEDSFGNVVDTDSTYAVGDEGIAPGESSTFTMYVDKNSKIERCTVTVYDYDAEKNYGSSSLADAQANLKLSNIKLEQTSSNIKCTGTITNNSSGKRYRFVQVKGSFKDSSGNVVDTDSTYAVGNEGLDPGESSTFTMYVDRNYSITQCSVSIYQVG